MTFLVSDILDYSNIINGKLRLNIEFFNLKNEVIDTLNLFESQAAAKKIQLKCNFNNQQHKINSDSIRVKQILTNLVGNAVKFTKKGFIEVSIK